VLEAGLNLPHSEGVYDAAFAKLLWPLVIIIRLHQMHETLILPMFAVSVCQSVCLSRGLNRRRRVQCTPRAVSAGSFGATSVKSL